MDEELRELEKLAKTDPEALHLYLRKIISSGMVYDIEIKAHLGDPAAIKVFLQILNLEGQVDLNNLWVCPYFFQPYDFPDTYDMWPYDQPFMPPLKYNLDMTLKEIDSYYEQNYEYGPKYGVKLVIGAFVVDVFDLESADSSSRYSQQLLEESLRETPRQGTVSTPEQARLISRYASSLNKFNVLKNSAILVFNREKGDQAHLVESQDLFPLLPRGQRSTFSHLQDIHHDEIMAAYQEGGSIPDVTTWWPHRAVKHLPISILSDRSTNLPYVLIVHVPTLRGFILGGNYNLLKTNVTQNDIIFAMRYNRQVDQWLPSQTSQMPDWAHNLPLDEFNAYWIAE